MNEGPLTNLVLQEASILNDIQVLARRAEYGEQVLARDISSLLNRYGVSFDELPSSLKHAIDEIDLAD